MIHIVIVEDNIEIVNMLSQIINSEKEFIFDGFAQNGKHAIDLIEKKQPDIVLLDIGLPDISGIECLKYLKPLCPDTQFLMCTIHDDNEIVFKALSYGANGYILKNHIEPENLISDIKNLKNGGSPLSNEIARKVLKNLHIKSDDEKMAFKLTIREQEILMALAKGMTYEETTKLLFLSVHTVKSHVQKIYEKLDVQNRTEAINKYFGKEI